MKIKLYNNTIELVFDENRHIYSVNDKKVDGVTSILSIINKPALIYWAVEQSINYLQNILQAGVSYDEIEIINMLNEAKRAHSKKKERSGDIGSLTHQWIKDWIAGKNPKKPENKEIKNAVEQFLKWTKNNKVKFIESEKIIYSKKYNYAGTMDFLCQYKDKKMIGDFKTSSSIWDEYYYQIAAYYQAYLEEKPNEKIDGGMIVKIGKDASLEVVEVGIDEIERDIIAFNSALSLYRRQNERKEKRLREKLNNEK